MKLYHYNKDGQYTRSFDARVNPRPDPELLNDEWLWRIPNTTIIAPSADVLAGLMIGIWDGNMWESVPLPDQGPSEEVLRKKIRKDIDKKTSEIIAYGFTYGTQQVELDLASQVFYESECNTLFRASFDAEFEEEDHFPIETECWTNKDGNLESIIFNSLAEYMAFIAEYMPWVRQCYASGWELKESIVGMNLDSLKKFTDVR